MFETREELSNSVQLSCQESEKQEEPERVVSVCLGIGGGGANVVCCESRLCELCENVTVM